jgi:Arc/MetJ family transcription regulator
MTRTLIDADDELLQRARAILGTSTKKDTVNAALAQVVALDARRQFLDDARAGALAEAADDAVMDRAWRQ